MNGRERLFAAVGAQPADRRAFVPVLSLYGAKLTGCPLQRYFTDPRAYADGQSAVARTFDPDVLFAPFALAGLGRVFGSELRFFDDQPPNVRRPALESVARWRRHRLPSLDRDPHLTYLRDAVALLAAEHRQERVIALALPPPTDIPALVFGMGEWLEAVLFDRSAAGEILAELVPWFVQLANRLFEAGLDVLALPCGFASPVLVTRAIASELTRPVLEQVVAGARGPVLLHNVGGPLLPNLDLFSDLSGLAGFVLDAGDDLARAREILAPTSALFGGVDPLALPTLTEAEVRAATDAVLRERAGDPRFVFVTTGADVPWDTPPANVHAMREAIVAFGAAG